MTRVSVTIAGNRLSDGNISFLLLNQAVGNHNTCELHLNQKINTRNLLKDKVDAWMGQEIKVGIQSVSDYEAGLPTLEDKFIGVVTGVSLMKSDGGMELVVKSASPTIAIDDGPNMKSYTDISLQEIIDKILQDYEGDKQVEPLQWTKPIPYIVQYNESAFDYIVRLASRYGDWFFYDGLKLIYGQPEEMEPIPLDFATHGLVNFSVDIKTVPTNFTMVGYDYETPTLVEKPSDPFLFPTSEIATKAWDKSDEIYKNNPLQTLQTSTDEKELEFYVGRRVQVQMDEIEVISAKSVNSKLTLGSTVEVKDDLVGEVYGTYRITGIIHHIRQKGEYCNNFSAVPVDLISPPMSRLPHAPFCETQLATVRKVDDENGLGRVQVQFFWQEDGETSPWIRVATPYAGKDKGFYIIPEVEDQVLVAFENNDPDKPYVLASMYNGDAKPEWFDGKNKTKGFKSKGQNQWSFDDKAKSITISAPDSMNLNAGKKINIKTGGASDSEITLDAGEGNIVLKARSIQLLATAEIYMDGGSGGIINMNADEIVSAGLKITLEADPIEINAVGGKVSISGANVDVTGTKEVKVTGGKVKLNS